MQSPRVVIGVPHLGAIPGYFFDSFVRLAKPAGASFVRVEDQPIDAARNSITRAFLERPEATHLFFMDVDMVFPVDALTRLLSRDREIIGGCYFSRDDAVRPHVYDFDHHEDGLRWHRSKWPEFAEYFKSLPDTPAGTPVDTAAVLPDSPLALVRCEAIATGCLLISRRVIEAIAAPWFECWPGKAGGEDFTFCEKALKAGFEVWADWSVQCAHEMRRTFVGRADFAAAAGIRVGILSASESAALGTETERGEAIIVEGGPREVTGNR